jgi:hypothetical protein
LVLMTGRKWGTEISFGKDKYYLKTEMEIGLQIDTAFQKLKYKNRSFSNIDRQLVLINLSLAKLIIDPSVGTQPWKKLSNDYKAVLKGIVSTSRKIAEIEQLEILIDALKLSKAKNAVATRSRLEMILATIQKLDK